MPETFDATAWTGLMLGAYSLFAGVGALRQPGVWRNVIAEVNESAALQMIASLIELLIGIGLYLANPWDPTDILACILKTIGGLAVIEALMMAAFNDIYTNFWMRNLNHMHRGWAIFSLLQGLVLTVAASLRFY